MPIELPESEVWEPVVEGVAGANGNPVVSDPLLGGIGGVLNRAAKQLANRTRYLLSLLLYYPLGEPGAVDPRYPVCNVRRYGAKGDGVTDESAAIDACYAAAPAGSTVVFPTGVYCMSACSAPTKSLTLDLMGSTFKATAVMNDVFAATDLDNITWRNGVIDGNNLAKSGATSYASLRSPKKVRFEDIQVINLPVDNTLMEGAIRTASLTGGGSGVRHADVRVDRCEVRNIGTSGVLIAYADGATISDLTGENTLNHLSEFVGCTDFHNITTRGKDNGGSAAACGDHSYHGILSGIVSDAANGDAPITVETTCADVRVEKFVVRRTWKAAVNANYGTPGVAPNDLLRGVEFSTGIVRAAGAKPITGATRANPCRLTVVGHGIKTITLAQTVEVSIAGVAGMVQLNGLKATVKVINANTLDLYTDATLATGIDSSAFAVYTGGGTIRPFAAGANIYGSSAPQARGVIVRDVDVYDFNTGIEMAYANGGECRHVRVWGLQGPNSALGRFTNFINGVVERLRCVDGAGQPTDPKGAIQFLNQPLTANQCDRVEVKDCFVLQAGLASDIPLIYIEGNGEFDIDGLRTGGASHFISVRAGDSPTIRLRNFSGALTSTPFLVGAGAAPNWFVEWEEIERTVAAAATLSHVDGHIRANAAGGAFPITLPPAATVPGKRFRITKVDATANVVTIQPTGADTIPTITTLATEQKSYELLARAGGYDIISAR